MTDNFLSVEAADVDRSPAAPAAAEPLATRAVRKLLASADVGLNGKRAWDLKVNDERLYRRVALDGLYGLGNAYVDGWWDCDAIDQFYDRCLRAGMADRLPLTLRGVTTYLRQTLTNPQRMGKARHNIESHYNLGIDLFRPMLDSRMQYSCGYWREADTLEASQEAKLDLACRKLGLRPGQRVLDIGCGWGGFAKHAAERYGVSVVGVTLSSDQAAYATGVCRGLPVEIRVQDYRDVGETFDHVASIAMVEHVGPKNLRTYMELVHRCLRKDGLFLLHFFATQAGHPSLGDTEVMWVEKHIFPAMAVPSLKQIGGAVERLFVTEDLHNFGADYDPTLMAWHANFERSWPGLEAKYGPRFYRTWKHYLLLCAAAFRSRKFQLWHLVFSKAGVPGGYVSVR